ncbi:MAG: DNA polymerase, partial [Myxococcota bacterium]
PHLRGKPVGVAPVMTESTCCIAASYEAKAYGIKTGTRISEARALCPNIQIVAAQPAKYVQLHNKLKAAVESCIHVEKVLSIDEMWCWLPYNLREHATVEKIARNIKQAIHEQVSPWIKGSIGIAPNKWLAKMASKMRKPNGLLIIQQQDLPEILYDLDLRDMHGVGRSMELRLHAQGIHDARALCHATREKLHRAWNGVEGDRLWLQLRGKEIPELETTRRSISHGHVLPPEKRFPNNTLPVLHKLTQKAAQRLRSHGMLTQSYQLSLKYVRGGRWHGEVPLPATDDSLLLARVASHLWKQRPHHKEHLLKVSMVLSRLTHADNYTPSLFDEDETQFGKTDQNIKSLNASMDQLVQKFGRQSIYLGGAHGAIEAAPMRIAFNHVPDLEIEKD